MRALKLCVPVLQVALSLLLFAPKRTIAFEQCGQETGGGICPDFNTCCRKRDGSSGCIASDMGRYTATCCGDGDGDTGCAVGYTCRTREKDCVASRVTNLTDPLVRVLPRYRLCNAQGIEHVQGLPVVPGAKLAYYSSHGPIETIMDSSIDMALVMIHGSGRNADDYFCSVSAAVELQTNYSNVLLITPRFYSESDQRDEQGSFLFWKDEGDGPWRYGADSLAPARVSSYTALDKLVESIWKQLPTLKKLVVAGHSSGGQTVQRWTLLTSSWVSGRMHSVVANPSSFAYLTPLRFIEGDWSLPSEDITCPRYNEWEWGLDDGGEMEVPYREVALRNTTHVIERFRDRRVFYLAGSQDRCNVSSTPGWCHSHGMETTCMDELQGSNRFERSARYVSSLRRLGFWKGHVRRVVQDVGHDHALMFQSPEGLEGVFGEYVDADAEVV